MAREKHLLPRKRTEHLIEVDLSDEVLVYDQEDQRAHALNGPAALVWRNLDGKTSVSALASRLRRDFGGDGPGNRHAVWLALKDLAKLNLLDGPVAAPDVSGVSRRQLLRRLVAAGVVVPAVASIVAPHAFAQAQSAIPCNNPGCSVDINICPNTPQCLCVNTTEGVSVCVARVCSPPPPSCTSSAQCVSPGSVCMTSPCCNNNTGVCMPPCVVIIMDEQSGTQSWERQAARGR